MTSSQTSLSNYQLGDLLGRGASGNVYRALNFLTGETVAIKSISLMSLPASSLPEIMSEIVLLKNLNHPNVVKYKGFTRDKENLFIVLEYCENGSLQSILKKFGKFPESLVAVYVSQVLEGLVYLHDQGVIHRDIKGANILTNKDGSVKLADFGVSSRAPTPDLAAVANGNADQEVVGSPYWMAPEVIEQSGATTASDIWSVGCVVVELLEGKPPYGDLAPLQALWRIVQDESMRIPEGASPIVKDFLYHCFQKDPNLRVTAKKLLRHPWMQSARKNLETGSNGIGTLSRPKTNGTPISATPSDKMLNGEAKASQPVAAVEDSKVSRNDGTTKTKKPITVYDEAVQRVQEWNEALNAAGKSGGTMRRIPVAAVRKPPLNEAGRKRKESLPSIPAVPILPGQPANLISQPSGVGLLQKNQHVSDVLSRARESNEAEKWDDDFAFEGSLPKIHTEPNQETVRQMPAAPHDKNKQSSQKPQPKLTGIVEDYSDLAAGEDEIELKLSKLKLPDHGRTRIMRPSDLRKIGAISMGPPPSRPKVVEPVMKSPKAPPTPSRQGHAADHAPLSAPMSRAAESIRSTSGSSVISASANNKSTPPGSRQSSLRGRKDMAENIELQKYSETDDEDYSDMFDGPVSAIDGTNTMGSLQLTRRSNRSWKDEDDDEDEADPFAEIEDEFDTEDIEANLLRDKRATLCSNVTKLVDQLEVGSSMSSLRSTCDELMSLFENAPDMGLETHFVSIHGMLAVLEIMESRLSRDVAVRLLKIVNFIVAFDVDNLESFCLVGGIPVIIPYTSKKHSLDTRLEASQFIQHLTRSALTLQMFISCRGLKVLVELLDEDYSLNKTLILSALEGIGSVFDLQSPTPKPDFCRMFTREGILDPLSTSLLAVIKDPEVPDDTTKRAVDVLLLFCQVAQADPHVQDAFATRTIMMRLLKSLGILPRSLLVTAVKAIKHLSTSPQLIEVLQNSNAMEVLVELLGKSIKGNYNEISSHIFQTIYSMCRLSKSRLEEAAASGIIPLLKRVIGSKSPLKQFSLPILCDLASAGKSSRRLLWQNDGMKIYVELLDDPYWRVSALEAILAWLQDETARVEDVLLDMEAAEAFCKCFVYSTGVTFENILDPFLKILRLSPSLTSAVSLTTFLRRLADALERPAKAVTKLNLLRMTRVVCESHPDRATLVSRYSLASIVDKLSKQDDAVLVRELAKEIYPSLLFGAADPAADLPQPKRTSSHVRHASNDGIHSMISSSTSMSTLAQARQLRAPSIVRRPASMQSVPQARTSSTASAPPPPDTPGRSSRSTTPTDDKLRHKRRVSRTQVRDVQWEPGENGRQKSVLRPSPTKTHFAPRYSYVPRSTSPTLYHAAYGGVKDGHHQ